MTARRGADPGDPDASDVVVIGDGVIGLSTALELARAGVRVHVVGARRDGAASGAAAGLLAPSLGRLDPRVRAFYSASLERYPAFLSTLYAYEPDLTLVRGLLQLNGGSEQPGPAPAAIGLTASALSHLEPGVVAPHGGLLHPGDGALDNVRLMSALTLAVEHQPGITFTHDDPAAAISFSKSGVRVTTSAGHEVAAGRAVLAAGAWSGALSGLPRAVPVTPLKGQMLTLRGGTLRHSIMAVDVYLVPRAEDVAVGATSEDAGFDTTVDPATIERLRQAAVRVYPALAESPVVRQWAGLRPATPDLLPIIGADPAQPALIYACGHSRNGILLAPETARVVARLALGAPPGVDLSPFAVTRFTAK